MIRLSVDESKDALEWMLREGLEVFAQRLHETGQIIYSDTGGPYFDCYLQAVICYALGFYQACIAAASIAVEFYLRFRMANILMAPYFGSDTPWELEMPNDRKKLLNSLNSREYGRLIELLRIDDSFKDLTVEVKNHEAMNRIRNAYLHTNIEKVRLVNEGRIKSRIGKVTVHLFPDSPAFLSDPLLRRVAVADTLVSLQAYWPREPALEALQIASKLLRPASIRNMNERITPLEKFKRIARHFFNTPL